MRAAFVLPEGSPSSSSIDRDGFVEKKKSVKQTSVMSTMRVSRSFAFALVSGAAAQVDNRAISQYYMVLSAYLFFFLFFYTLLALLTWPYVRFRTGIPFFFLFLIILFPPSFLVLLFSLLLLRFGCLATAWYVVEAEQLERQVQASPRSQRVRSRV